MHRRAVLKTHLRASSDGSEMEGARPFVKRQRKIFCSSSDFFSQKQLREKCRRIRFAFSLRIPTVLNFPAAYSCVTRGQVDGEVTFCALVSLKNFSHNVLDISENNFTKNKSDLFFYKTPQLSPGCANGISGVQLCQVQPVRPLGRSTQTWPMEENKEQVAHDQGGLKIRQLDALWAPTMPQTQARSGPRGWLGLRINLLVGRSLVVTGIEI